MEQALPTRYARLRDVLAPALSDQPPDSRSSLGELLARHGTLQGAVTYAALFCPPLLEVDGRVYQTLVYWLPEDPAEAAESLRSRIKAEVDGDARRFQALHNHVHVIDLFDYSLQEGDVDDEEWDMAALLVELMGDAWRAWLGLNYPGREFVVQVVNPLAESIDGDDMDFEDFEVSFYEDR